jgi:micrococcal nuclease
VPRPAPSRPRPRPVPAASAPAPSGGAYYTNCAAARAAGAAPLYRGQAGYAAKLDRDSDGVACE